MDFNQIVYFLAIVEQGSFTNAAYNVFISPSSLSKQIKALEVELGVRLFSRENYKIELTDAGKIFLPFAKKISQEYSNMLSGLTSLNSVNDSIVTVKIGTIPVLCCRSIIDKVANLESKNQNIHIDLLEREQSELIKLLDGNQIDFAIARIDYLSSDDFDFIPLETQEIGAICHINSRFASKMVLSLRELKDEPFLLLNSTSSLHRLCMESCKNAGFSPRINYLSSRHEALLAMINTGSGVTLLPKSLLDPQHKKNLKYIPLKEKIYSTIAIIRKKDMKINKKIINFQTIIRENFAEQKAADKTYE